MRKNERHIIHRVNVDINTNSKRSAEHINKNVNRYVHDMILPAIEELIAQKYANYSLRLDALDVDVSFLSEKQINGTELKMVLENALEKAIIQNKSLEFDQHFEQVNHDNTTLKVSRPWEVVLYFLRHGSLPWFVDHDQKLDFWIDICDEMLKSNRVKKEEVLVLALLLEKNEIAGERMLKQFPESFVGNIVVALNGRISTHAWSKFKFELVQKFEKVVALKLMIYALQIGAKSAQNLMPSGQEILWELGFLLKKVTIGNDESKPKSNIISENQLKQAVPIFQDFLVNINQTLDLSEALKTLPASSELDKTLKLEQTFAKPEELTLDIYQFAGLILLHPYLKMFFKNIGVLKENEMHIAPEQYDLAAHSLHFLATGEFHAYEADMQFAKWLLNIPDGVVLDRNFIFNENIKSEAEDLLSSVVENWSALKNSSNDTLRAMFFQRSASLKEDASCYQLHFERKAQDVLLQQLPWSISFVKLPWKQKLIQVMW